MEGGLVGAGVQALEEPAAEQCGGALAGEELDLQARLYGVPDRARRIAGLCARLDLEGLAPRPAGSLSGGQRRRPDIALGLVHLSLAPGWLDVVSRFTPFRYMVDAARAAFPGEYATAAVAEGTLVTVVLVVVSVTLGARRFRAGNP